MTSLRSSASPSIPKARLNTRLDRGLAAYASAASVAGVTLLAAQPAAAEVVYTPAYVTMEVHSVYPIDLNHDGVADFTLIRCELSCEDGHSSFLLLRLDVPGNQAIIAPITKHAPIGPGQRFTSSTYAGGVFMADGGSYDAMSWFFGPWANQSNSYLGLKFLIDGQVHYGWARLSVNGTHDGGYIVTLSGYAYERTPGHEIFAGSESGAEATDRSAPAAQGNPALRSPSLGMLALGADALSLWRAEQK